MFAFSFPFSLLFESRVYSFVALLFVECQPGFLLAAAVVRVSVFAGCLAGCLPFCRRDCASALIDCVACNTPFSRQFAALPHTLHTLHHSAPTQSAASGRRGDKDADQAITSQKNNQCHSLFQLFTNSLTMIILLLINSRLSIVTCQLFCSSPFLFLSSFFLFKLIDLINIYILITFIFIH